VPWVGGSVGIVYKASHIPFAEVSLRQPTLAKGSIEASAYTAETVKFGTAPGRGAPIAYVEVHIKSATALNRTF